MIMSNFNFIMNRRQREHFLENKNTNIHSTTQNLKTNLLINTASNYLTVKHVLRFIPRTNKVQSRQ